MVSWLSLAAQFWNQWSVRVVVLSSFAANAVLVVLAGIRRRQASGWGTLLLWLAYQLTDLAATYALGNLSLSRSSASLPERQLVAFWAPFLLLHLAGPDNISGYTLEDNKLSMRQALHVVAQVIGAWYVFYKHIYLVDSGVLLPASAIMLAVGVAKYVERVCALWRGDLGHIRSSRKKQKPGPGCFAELVCFRRERKLDNEKALLFAHDMFHVCNRAMVDSSVDLGSPLDGSGDNLFSLRWSSMSKVVEMELSLMYDVLYTKVTVIHTWGGYLIRFISALATVIVNSLFWIYPKEGQRKADVIITYILLVSASFLEATWLVRAIGSSWTCAFLNYTPWAWLQHAFLCSGRWRQLRRVMLSLDPSRLLGKDPSSYRLWPCTIGRYNLLDECIRSHGSPGLCSTLVSTAGLEDIWNEYKHSRCLFQLPKDVKKLLFQRIQRRLPSSYSNHGEAYSMKDITTCWGQVAVKRSPKVLQDLVVKFGREFQQDILVWHIGTCIFLSCADQQLLKGTHVKPAIEALSEYLMFLVAVRRHMLPGLALRSLFEVTLQALSEVCQKNGLSVTARKEKLAEILRHEKYNNWDWCLNDAKSSLVSDGAELAIALLKVRPSSDMPELLELIFNVWVNKLLYASTRCSRESHAKQIGRGGELTTIVWIMAEHGGPFRIGETSDETSEKEAQDEGKKKEAEEKKKKEEEEKKKCCCLLPVGPVSPPQTPVPVEPELPRKDVRPIKYATLYSA